MRYIDYGTGGGADCLQIKETDKPVLRAGEVLIEVAYAGVNRPDILQRSGSYPPPPNASPYLGLEVSGTVVAVEGPVTNVKVGDQVCALTPGGGYAEFVAVPAGHCLPIPTGLSLLEAAAVPENYFTVWTNVFERGRLQKGETILIHGGSSGIGLTAIQLAKQFGATVYTTVGNDEKAEACKKYGADLVINYKTQDFQEVIAQETEGKGVNLILDMVGALYLQKNIASLALEGRLVQIAFLHGSVTEIDATPIMLKRLTFTGSTLRARPDGEKQQIAETLQEQVFPLLQAGKAKPVLFKTFDFEDVIAAHELMESSTHIGKIMLKVKP